MTQRANARTIGALLILAVTIVAAWPSAAGAQCAPSDSTQQALENGFYGAAYDAGGNLFVFGSDNIVRKISPAGNELLSCCEVPLAGSYTGIAVDALGNIYLSAREFDFGSLGFVGSIRKYSNAGTFLTSWPAGGAGS